MYRAHSKDINRNKSFHTLTFRNLRKVEILKEKEEEKKKSKEERQKELQRDQDEQRYEELIGGEGSFKGVRRIKNIFAAEYDADKAQALKAEKTSSGVVQVAPHDDFNLMKKFIKDEDCKRNIPPRNEPEQKLKGKTFRECSDDFSEGPAYKQCKVENMNATIAGEVVHTGFVSTSEAALRRKEVEMMKKEKVDPLQKLKAFQNKTVAAASRRHRQQDEGKNPSLASSQGDATQEAIRARMKELLAGKIR